MTLGYFAHSQVVARQVPCETELIQINSPGWCLLCTEASNSSSGRDTDPWLNRDNICAKQNSLSQEHYLQHHTSSIVGNSRCAKDESTHDTYHPHTVCSQQRYSIFFHHSEATKAVHSTSVRIAVILQYVSAIDACKQYRQRLEAARGLWHRTSWFTKRAKRAGVSWKLRSTHSCKTHYFFSTKHAKILVDVKSSVEFIIIQFKSMQSSSRQFIFVSLVVNVRLRYSITRLSRCVSHGVNTKHLEILLRKS